MLTFDPKTGLAADQAEDIRESVRTDWKDAFAEQDQPELDTGPETPAGQLIDSQAAIIARKDADLLYLANQFNPDVNEGVWQDALGRLYFLTRKTAEPTLVECVCTGLAGTLIPGWSLAQSTEGMTLVSTAPAVIGDDGTVRVTFRGYRTGPDVIPPHSVTRIITTVPGWDAIDNPLAGVIGRDQESRADFEARRRASVAANAHGSAASVYGTVANVKGVLHCRVLENVSSVPQVRWGVVIGPHSILVSVYGGDDTDIARAIYLKKDAGCGTSGNTTVRYVSSDDYDAVHEYKIVRPYTGPFAVRVTINVDRQTPADVEERIKDAVLANFNGEDSSFPRVTMAQTVYAGRFAAPVVNAGGRGLVNIKIAIPANSANWMEQIDIDASVVPVLSRDDIHVVVQE